VLNLEGNPTCSSLGPNSEILEIKISGPDDSGDTVEVVGPPLEDDPPAPVQRITYRINTNNAVSWDVIPNDPLDPFFARGLAVNYVILKGKGQKGGGTVYHYGAAPGSGGDSGLVLFPDPLQPDQGPSINALSFCYGLSGEGPGPSPTPTVTDLGNCADLTDPTQPDKFTLDGTTFNIDSCPQPGTNPGERIIVSFDPNKDNFGLHFCTCNLEGGAQQGKFEKCDANATQTVNVPQGPDACPNGQGFVERVPINILGVEDPGSFLCFAVTGDRSCYFHDSK